MSTANEKILTDKIIETAIKFYDSTISVIFIFFLLLNLVLTSFNYLNQETNFILLAFLIIILDLIFKYDPILNITTLNRIMASKSRIILEKFIKGMFYLLILFSLITSPPGVPPSFIFQVASIDLYFLLSLPIITGLYFSIYPVLKTIFEKDKSNTF